MTPPNRIPWPLRLDPLPGEALDSWLEALAARHDTPLADLLDAAGLEPEGRPSSLPGHPRWLVQLDETPADLLAALSGVPQQTLHDMTLRRFSGTALVIDVARGRVERRRLWGRGSGSRYCPNCLRENTGRWALA